MDSIVKIRLVVMGVIPKEFKLRKIIKWKSQLFTVQGGAHYSMNNILPDLPKYAYSDDNFRNGFPNTDRTARQSEDRNKTDLTIYLVDVPIEGNFFSRIFDKNRIVITFYDAKNKLKEEHIPFENYILKRFYMYSLLFLSSKEGTVVFKDEINYLHYYRNGCLFDGCFLKEEFVDSCINPIICDSCISKLHSSHIKEELLREVKVELKRISRGCYYGIVQWLHIHPLAYLLVSALVSAIVGAIITFSVK